MQLLATSLLLPADVKILQKLFSFCPSLIPGIPRQAAETWHPGTGSGKVVEVPLSQRETFLAPLETLQFHSCINEFAAGSNPSSALKQMYAFKHKALFLNSRQWSSASRSPSPRDKIQNTWNRWNSHHKYHFGFPSNYFFFLLIWERINCLLLTQELLCRHL